MISVPGPSTAGPRLRPVMEAIARQPVVWIADSGPAEDFRLECIDLPVGLRRAAKAAPRSFSLMVRASSLECLDAAEFQRTFGRVHRIVIFNDRDLDWSTEIDVAPTQVGYLPRPLDVETFAGAIAWLSALPHD